MIKYLVYWFLFGIVFWILAWFREPMEIKIKDVGIVLFGIMLGPFFPIMYFSWRFYHWLIDNKEKVLVKIDK